MPQVVDRQIDGADSNVIERLCSAGVTTAHEAADRIGLLAPEIQPIQDGERITGSAVTVSCHPGDNLMIHAAVEVHRAR